ncbi:hypothetical protein [Novosphingobium sp. HII-3]|uniref:hypothetical protein n=1 Tax=Novosphingobium sp. HII-3 TaxID=2075565 RepID=UPI001304EE19|nr:hypothetical protein [Novosphingobium sp. HII-3]
MPKVIHIKKGEKAPRDFRGFVITCTTRAGSTASNFSGQMRISLPRGEVEKFIDGLSDSAEVYVIGYND